MLAKFGVEDVLIRVQPTPNPYALKFIANHAFKSDGKATFSVVAECDHIPLARDLLTLSSVKQIHFFQNTVTVTHDGSLNDDEMEANVSSIIKTRLPAHDPHFQLAEEAGVTKPVVDRSKLSPELLAIEEILDRTIRPGLQADGGDVQIISFDNDELRIVYEGACGGCPSSMMGTLDAIQGILQNETGNLNLRVRPI